jgi:flagellar protein FlbT
MALKLSLKPHERLVLNGAVLQNGDRRGVILLQNKASVLREKDIMQEDEANSPSRRIYFAVMMMYIDEVNAARYHEAFVHRLQEFMGAIRNPDVLTDCVTISRHVLAREFYKALMLCRKLIAYEDERLKDVPASLSAGGRAV